MITRTVLIIDDNHLDRYIISEFLGSITECKYEFIEASNAEKGLEILDEIIPDCILLDNIMMGYDMNGIDSLPFIKKTQNKFTPIIMVTGSPTPELEEQALAQGVSYFLDKLQIEPEFLHNLISKLIVKNTALREMTV